MSRLMITSDLHLGHKNIHKFRDQFSTAEEHHEVIFDNLASNIGKRDSLIFLGDVAFDYWWLGRLKSIKCAKKTLILGNHDTEHLKMWALDKAFDSIHSMFSKRNMWFSHCPIHPDQFRDRLLNIHGHLHDKKVLARNIINNEMRPDLRYFNACVEHTDYKPISFSEILESTK